MSEPLRTAEMRAALRGSVFASISYTRETASTNDDALVFLDDARPEGRIFLADFQRSGRARRGRTWTAPPGSAILMTLVLPRTVAPRHLWGVPFWTSLQVADAIEQVCGLVVDLKWPNDLMLGEGKCAGLLCTSRTRGDRAAVACGIGINVERPAGDATIDPRARYLSEHVPGIAREPLIVAIAELCEARLHALGDPRAIAATWEARANLAGTRYTLALDGSSVPFACVARGIADGGGMRVQRPDGSERIVDIADATVIGRE